MGGQHRCIQTHGQRAISMRHAVEIDEPIFVGKPEQLKI
jgi:hypothetical protein